MRDVLAYPRVYDPSRPPVENLTLAERVPGSLLDYLEAVSYWKT
jgi:hypothetical protein